MTIPAIIPITIKALATVFIGHSFRPLFVRAIRSYQPDTTELSRIC